MHCQGGEGSAGQIHQLASNFIVPKNHDTSFLASQRLLEGETGVTTVAFAGEVARCFCASH
jgi:hypothetical protein